MQFASNVKRRQNRRSAAARKAVSARQVRRRRQAQQRQRFSAAVRALEGAVQWSRGWLPGVPWAGLWQRIKSPVLPGFSGFVPSKLLSFALVALVAYALYWMQSSDSFFVYQEDVQFEGAGYLSDGELYALCDVENWSILWLEPELIRAQVLAHPYVADAQVAIRWPAQVQIAVEEVRPVALWNTDQQAYWLLADGTALAPRTAALEPELRILDPSAAARVENVTGGLQIDSRILASALSLTGRLSGVNEFWYNSGYGLNFSLPSTQAWIYWGDGRKFEQKWAALQASLPELESAGGNHLTLNISAPNRPFIRRYAAAPAGQ